MDYSDDRFLADWLADDDPEDDPEAHADLLEAKEIDEAIQDD